MNLPNILTIVRMALVPVFIVFYYMGFHGWDAAVAAVFLIAAVTDWLDGYIARRYNLITNFGKLMDPIADKILVASAMLLLIDCGRLPAWICVIIIGREFVIGGFRMVAASGGVVIAAGMAGKIKTVLQDIAIFLLFINDPIIIFGAPLGLMLMYISAALSIWSCAEYIIKNKAAFR